jgi:NAD(P)-dependent dehydrogenase (short-subunit alcohol dehydrogenase family)
MTSDSSHGRDLEGQVALVTGASRGLGQGFARALAGAGAKVALVARSTAGLEETGALIEGDGGRSLSLPCDVVDRSSVRATVKTAVEELGPIDILVNNAGIAGPTGPDWELDPAEWWRVTEVNLLGPFHFAQAVLPDMVTRGSGRVINVSSGAAGSASPGYSGYCASKAALTMWTECLAGETAEHGVAVLAYTPGLVRTDMTEYSASRPDKSNPLVAGIQRTFAEGTDVPMERTVRQFMLVASGHVDALSGRQVGVHDDLGDLLARAQEVEELGLYAVRIRGLASA